MYFNNKALVFVFSLSINFNSYVDLGFWKTMDLVFKWFSLIFQISFLEMLEV